MPDDLPIRLAAFEWLGRQVEAHGDVLRWALISRGFDYQGERVPLVSQQGIFKPRVMELPLSIRTSAHSPYDDAFGDVLLYRYRGTDAFHRENQGLREAMRRHLPLVYFHALEAGRYFAKWPVYVVHDDPGALAFTVSVDDAEYGRPGPEEFEVGEVRRRYVTATFRRRLHQEAFRERVLRAYRESCAMCRLRHRELLDAAHIVADREPEGEPRVTNGLALCKLHHAAFDSFFVTVDPDYRIVVRADVLAESDGPMLVHGLQELEGRRIGLPGRTDQRPSRDALAVRLERFRRAG